MPSSQKHSGIKPLHWYDFITINLFWIGLNIRNNAFGAIFMPYLVNALVRGEIQNTALGFMRTAGLIVAMLVQPAIGAISDRSTFRIGRRRPFIFVGVLLDLVFLAAIGLAWDYWSLLIAVLFLQVSANISHGALQGLIPDLVPEEQRGRASAVKAIFELLPLILLAFTIARLVSAGQLGWAITATAAGLLATMILTMVFVKELPQVNAPQTPLGPLILRVLGMLSAIVAGAVIGLASGGVLGGFVALIGWFFTSSQTAVWFGVGVGGLFARVIAVIVGVWVGAFGTLGRDARRHSAFTWWIVNRLLFLAAVTSIQGFAPYFLMYVFSVNRDVVAQMTGNLLFVVGIFTLLAALPGGWLSDRFGRVPLLGVCGVIAAAGTLLLLSTVVWPDLVFIYIAGCIIGISAGLFTSINWALGTELAPPQEAGRYLGVSNLAGAGAGMIGTGIGGPLADFFNQQQPGLGYFVIFSCYGMLFVVSAVSLLGVRKGRKVIV